MNQSEQNKTAEEIFDDAYLYWSDVNNRQHIKAVMIKAMEEYASQQTASLQKQVELLKVRAEKLAEREQRTGAENAGLLARIEQLQAENAAANKRIEELTTKNLKLLNENNDLWDKVNNPKIKAG